MKTVHWSMLNGSGMHRVAASMARAELAIGVESRCLDPFDKEQKYWDWALDADVHIGHTHIPDQFNGKSFRKQCTKPFRWVFPVHGTPELVFESSVKDAENNGYNTGTSFAHHQISMQNADAIVTFWSRHQALYQLATDKHTIVDLIPMGIDLPFWSGGVSQGKYAGTPSFLSCENQYPFKWSVEIIRLWPWVRAELDQAYLHATNLPGTLQRFVDVMAARYGSLYGGIFGSWNYDPANLRNILKQVDFYISPVRYGDHNRMSLEAGAAGAKVISFEGNEYADFWMREGDHRRIAKDIIAIGKGDVQPRADKLPVPTERQMAEAMVNVYERILDRPQTQFAPGVEMPDAIPQTIRDALLSSIGPNSAEAGYAVSKPAPLTVDQVKSIAAAAEAARDKVVTLATTLPLGEEPAPGALTEPADERKLELVREPV